VSSENGRVVEFWAKTTSDKQPGVSVLEHMRIVAFVAHAIAGTRLKFLSFLPFSPENAGAIAALHDLGKISPGFQRKCEAWVQQYGLADVSRRGVWDTSMESDHAKVTHAATQAMFDELGVDHDVSMYLSAILGGHHGRLTPPSDWGYQTPGATTEEHSGIDWNLQRKRAAMAVLEEFNADMSALEFGPEMSPYWWLGGLTSVADWIGSDERYFPTIGGMKTSDVRIAVEECVNGIGLTCPQIVQGLKFQDLFGDVAKSGEQFKPNDMQKMALSNITGPGVYVIEAPMGMGKTEAALAAAYQLLEKQQATGIFFALPTQATCNRMYMRLGDFVKRISPASTTPMLIHANSWLLDEKEPLRPARTIGKGESDAWEGTNWFSSAKRALLAPFGVGTIDQALLGIVAAKHFFVRQFALAGKVVIIDEVHSYDVYTGTLIDQLISTLRELGCTVIVLSATLTGRRRGQIVRTPHSRRSVGSPEPYPLIVCNPNGKRATSVPAKPPKSRSVQVAFRTRPDAVGEAVTTVKSGGCVVWICNTVGSSQRDFAILQDSLGNEFPVGLLHSRFPFWRRKDLEEDWMNRLGKESSSRSPSLLVSTQIVEQSVDIDADLMITELAPTDMLLQRMGRLWRHDRTRTIKKARFLIIDEQSDLREMRKMEPADIKKTLGDKAFVYDPYVLLRTLQVWKKTSSVKLPSGVRRLVEATYRESRREPDSWHTLDDSRFATNAGKNLLARRNCNLWQVALEDDEGIQTRLNERPTRSLILCRSWSEREIEFVDGTRAILGEKEFNLQTAQGIHRNLVKIPEYCFGGSTETSACIRMYLHGPHAIGCVKGNGQIVVRGLKDGIILYWDNSKGVIIEGTNGQEAA
jgi:CRISPR-associated endonuclease/helicase Cas3